MVRAPGALWRAGKGDYGIALWVDSVCLPNAIFVGLLMAMAESRPGFWWPA